MSKIKLWQYLFLGLTILLLPGCSQESRITDNGISQQEAIDTALKIASMPRPEVSGSQVAPSNIHVERITFGEAKKRMGNNNDIAIGDTPDMLVWLVTMDGIWLDEFPRATDSPTPEPYQHFIIIVEAKLGLEIESVAFP